MAQNPAFVKSVQNSRPVDISNCRFESIRTGYQLYDTGRKGHVLSNKFSLPGKGLNISCDVSSGTIAVSLFDEKGQLITASQPISGGLKIRKPVSWPDGFRLHHHVSNTVSMRFELTGGAKLFAIHFDEVFWE